MDDYGIINNLHNKPIYLNKAVLFNGHYY